MRQPATVVKRKLARKPARLSRDNKMPASRVQSYCVKIQGLQYPAEWPVILSGASNRERNPLRTRVLYFPTANWVAD